MNWQEKEDMLDASDKRFCNLFSTLPEHRRTANVSWAAVEADPMNLAFVPRQHISEDLIRMAVGKDGYALEYAYVKSLSENIYRIAVNQNGGALEFVPEQKRTSELCMDAVKQNGWAIKSVPDKMKTEEMCRLALSSDAKPFPIDCNILSHIPFPNVLLEGMKQFAEDDDPHEIVSSIKPQIMTPEIAMYAVEMEPTCFKQIPDRLRTPELCMAAIKENGLLLGNVIMDKRTTELCEAAIKNNYHSLMFVPDHMKSEDLLTKAYLQNVFAIRYFPSETLTKELCQDALKKADSPAILRYIPHMDIYNEYYESKCNDYRSVVDFFKSVNPQYLDPGLVDRVLENDFYMFVNIPDDLKTLERCKKAVREDPNLLEYVPEYNKTEKICKTALFTDSVCIDLIPSHIKTPDFYASILSEKPKILPFIPKHERTEELCRIALQNTSPTYLGRVDIFKAIPFESVLKDAIRFGTESYSTRGILRDLNESQLSPTVVLEGIKKDYMCIDVLDERYKTADFYNLAIRANPEVFRITPRHYMNPESALFAVKSDPTLAMFVPSTIRKGDNIYSFHEKIEFRAGYPLTFDQHKELYHSGKTQIERDTQETGKIIQGYLHYSKHIDKLFFTPNIQGLKEIAKNGMQNVMKPKGRKL